MWPCPCNYHASPILAAFADPSPPSNATLSTIAITRSNNLPFSKLSAAIQQSQLSYDLYLIARQLYFYFFSSSLSFRSRIFLRSKRGNVVHRRKFPRLFTMLVTSLFDEGTISKLNDIGDAIEGLRDRGSNKRLSPISTRERELSLLQRSAFRVSLPREINDTWKTDYRATLFHRSSSIYSLRGISRFGSVQIEFRFSILSALSSRNDRFGQQPTLLTNYTTLLCFLSPEIFHSFSRFYRMPRHFMEAFLFFLQKERTMDPLRTPLKWRMGFSRGDEVGNRPVRRKAGSYTLSSLSKLQRVE